MAFSGLKAVLDTIRFNNETALYSVFFHNFQRRITSSRGKAWALPFPVEAETKPVTNPKAGKLSFSLPSTMESVSEIEAAAEKLAAEAGIDEDERFRITMAVREAAVNAVLHGNDYDPATQVTASFENNGKSLIFTLADQGKGVDWENLPDPLAPENLLRGTGRGIFLIRSFMDEVHFRQLQPGTELTLVKHLTPAPEQPQAS